MIEGRERKPFEQPVVVDRGQLARCAVHGLHFDATKSNGCVLCRRLSGAPRPEGRHVKVRIWMAVGGVVLALAGVGVAVGRGGILEGTPATALTAASPGQTLTPRSRIPSGFGRAGHGLSAINEQAVREAVARIAKLHVACAGGGDEDCTRLAQECAGFGFVAGSLLLPAVGLHQHHLALRQACDGAVHSVRQRCVAGSAAACDAAVRAGWLPNPGSATLQDECDSGSASGCEQLAQHLSSGSAEREAAKLRADALRKCEAEPEVACLAASREQLRATAIARQKQDAREQCRTGTADDCARYAAAYSHSEPRDLAFRAELIQEACRKGSESNCALLSVILAEGRGLPQDPARALELRDQGVAAALDELKKCEGPECALLQFAYANGGDMMEQIRRAETAPEVVARECDAGKLGACEGLRAVYSRGASRLPGDPTKASAFGAKANQLLEHQCQTGDRNACRTLVQHLLHFSPADVPRGRRLADQACASGDYSECWKLGEFLSEAGPNREPIAASGYFGRAVAIATTECDAGEVGACYLLVDAYGRGQGVARDRKKSADYTEKAVDLTLGK